MTLKKQFPAVAAVAAVALTGCSSDGEDGDKGGGATLPQGGQKVKLRPSDFSTRIDNPWFPIRPGARWVYRNTDVEGARQRNVVTVTRRTKRMANGIVARVVHDTVTEGRQLVENTYDWFAQDSKGNVWYLGEDTTEYAEGKPKTTAGSFEVGKGGAQAGVIMPAKPETGMAYRQEFLRGQAEDRARILSLTEQAEVPHGHYSPALMTSETSPLEPRVVEYKFYAKGVGPLLSIASSGGTDREELVSYRTG